MTIYDSIAKLCHENGIAITALESELGLGRGLIGKWKNGTSPNLTKLQKIADYFGVTINYLLTGEEDWHPTISEKEEKDIQKQLQKTLDQLESETGLMFDGDYMDEEAREKLKNSLELVMRGARIEAKEKFTPKKYKK